MGCRTANDETVLQPRGLLSAARFPTFALAVIVFSMDARLLGGSITLRFTLQHDLASTRISNLTAPRTWSRLRASIALSSGVDPKAERGKIHAVLV
jgi:hypothetical protein